MGLVGPAQGSVALPVGSVAFVPPGVLHAHSWRGGDHYAIHFDLHAKPGLASPNMLHKTGARVVPRPLARMPTFDLHRPGPGHDLRFALVTPLTDASAWFERCERLSYFYLTRTHRSLSATIETHEMLLWMLGSLAKAQVPIVLNQTRRAEGLIAQLNDLDIARPWTLSGLARKTGMGRTSFWSAFVSATGMTPRKYFEARRIEWAANQIRDTDGPIHRIAAHVGFRDAFYFSRVFRRVIGIGPRAFRRSHRPETSTRRR